MVSKHFGRGQGGVSRGKSSIERAKQDQSNRDRDKAARAQRDQNRQGGRSIGKHGRSDR